MNIAVILAAGSGKRLGGDIPKQFVIIGSQMVIEYSIEQFQQHPDIDEIAVVTSADFVDIVNNIKANPAYSKLKAVLLGGVERYQSSLAAIRYYASQPEAVLLIHDAARPLVSRQIIDDVLTMMKTHNAAVVAIPATDTVLYSQDNHCVTEIPPRSQMYYAQTPQAFRQKTIQRAFEIGLRDTQFNPTDDSGVVLRYLPEESIAIVGGESLNKKITYQDDLSWLSSQIKKN